MAGWQRGPLHWWGRGEYRQPLACFPGAPGKNVSGGERGWDPSDGGHTPGVLFPALEKQEENGNSKGSGLGGCRRTLLIWRIEMTGSGWNKGLEYIGGCFLILLVSLVTRTVVLRLHNRVFRATAVALVTVPGNSPGPISSAFPACPQPNAGQFQPKSV